MLISRLKKQQRGQIRAVDFIVSLLLFLLMLSQLILIVVNVQSGIKSGSYNTISYEELDSFGRLLLQESGDTFWGYQRSLPDTFGLSIDQPQSHLVLDAAKIARIITETSFPISSIAGFEMYDYDTLKESLNLNSEWDFQLSIQPFIDVEVSISEINSTANKASVIAKNHFSNPIVGAESHFFIVDLIGGNIISEGITLTDNDGETFKEYLIPNINDPDREHIVFVIIKKEALWGLQWGYLSSSPLNENVIIGKESNTTIWGGGINSSALLLTDILEVTSTPDSHYLSIIYENTIDEYSNLTLNLESQVDGNETIIIPNKGLVVFFSITRTLNNFRVGIGSYPAILDNDHTRGLFYPIFGKLNPDNQVKSMLSKTYPIIVRGTLMQCQLTLWSE